MEHSAYAAMQRDPKEKSAESNRVHGKPSERSRGEMALLLEARSKREILDRFKDREKTRWQADFDRETESLRRRILPRTPALKIL